MKQNIRKHVDGAHNFIKRWSSRYTLGNSLIAGKHSRQLIESPGILFEQKKWKRE